MSERTMTGPEHVTEAARLENLALDQWERSRTVQGIDLRYERLASLTMRQAQLHASLAHTAAVLEAALPVEDRGFPYWQPQWSDVFATTREPPAAPPRPERPTPLSEIHEQLPDLS